MNPGFKKTVIINAVPEIVWSTLTDFTLMKQWMGESEMKLEIITDWNVNGPVIINGFHHVKFQNKGTVLKHEPNKVLEYSHLSSLSGLEDKPEKYSILRFELSPLKQQAALTLTTENFPTETIYKHLCFYWGATVEKIKAISEQQSELVN
jgi:uncharacterized protein YndB with AHSA1/START domain